MVRRMIWMDETVRVELKDGTQLNISRSDYVRLEMLAAAEGGLTAEAWLELQAEQARGLTQSTGDCDGGDVGDVDGGGGESWGGRDEPSDDGSSTPGDGEEVG